MDAESDRHAAEILLDAWRNAAALETLPGHCRPCDGREGFAIQSEFVRLTGQEVVGWKIAATSIAGQRHLAVSGPLPGRLLAGRMLEPGSVVPIDGNRMRVVEPEFVFTMARDLPVRSGGYSTGEVLSAVAALSPGLEIPDSRYAEYVGIGEALLLADNACACWFMLGPPAPEAWRDLDLAAHSVALSRNGRPAGTGIGANVLGDPRVALTWLANELGRYGEFLRAGQIVTTGTCAVPVPVEDGLAVTADFGLIGRMAARFEESVRRRGE
jgi:2-keto-4-pentenoate hydratase